MPIPLGILAAAGVVPAAGGSYELIETITVGSGGAASVTFSNLNTYSSTYQHLQIRMTARSDTSNSQANALVRINADTGSNYANHLLYADGSGVYSGAATSQTSMEIGATTTDARSANIFSAGVIDLLDPYESKNKTIRTLIGSTEFNRIFLSSGLYMSTTSVSSVNIRPSAGNWKQYSRFSIYGLRGV